MMKHPKRSPLWLPRLFLAISFWFISLQAFVQVSTVRRFACARGVVSSFSFSKDANDERVDRLILKMTAQAKEEVLGLEDDLELFQPLKSSPVPVQQRRSTIRSKTTTTAVATAATALWMGAAVWMAPPLSLDDSTNAAAWAATNSAPSTATTTTVSSSPSKKGSQPTTSPSSAKSKSSAASTSSSSSNNNNNSMPSEQKAVLSAKSNLETATKAVKQATVDFSQAKTVHAKATQYLAKQEQRAKSTKQAFLQANDQYSQLKTSKKKTNDNVLIQQKQKVEATRAADRQAQTDLVNARLQASLTQKQLTQTELALKRATKAQQAAQTNVQTTQKKYDSYVKNRTAAEKKAAQERAKKQAQERAQRQKQQELAAKRAKEQAKVAKERAKKEAELQAKQRQVEQERARKEALLAKQQAAAQAQKIKQAGQRIKELQSAKNQVEMTAKKAAAQEAKLEAELKQLEKLKQEQLQQKQPRRP